MKKIIIILLFASQTKAYTQPAGFYVMQAVHNQNVTDATMSSIKLTGIHFRDEWQLLEPSKDTYSFSWLDSQFARAKNLNKRVTLGIYAGNNAPIWAGSILNQQTAFNSMVIQLGQHFANNPSLDAVHISSPTTTDSMEMFLPSGITSAQAVTSWESSIDTFNIAFPNKTLILDLTSQNYVDTVAQYAKQVLGSRANFIMCSLKATTSLTAPHYQEIVKLHNQGAQVGFEMVGPSTDTARFGGSFLDALNLGKQAGASWYQIYQADIGNIPNNFFPIVGDYNNDGKVDSKDYTVWRNSFNSITNLAADGNHNGRIDAGDYIVWRNNLLKLSVVPEFANRQNLYFLLMFTFLFFLVFLIARGTKTRL